MNIDAKAKKSIERLNDNGLSFNKGVLYSDERGYLGMVNESHLIPNNDPTSEKCLSPGEWCGEIIRHTSMSLYDSLAVTFSPRGIKKAVFCSSYGGKYQHLFLYSKRKRIRKKHQMNAFVEMVTG